MTTREQAKKMLPIIQAFADGKTIQAKCGTYYDWEDVSEDANASIFLDGRPWKYRIKPEPTYRPFRTKEECWNEMLKHQPFGWVKYGESICSIQNIVSDNITITDYEELYYFDLNDSFMNLKFTDNTPFGIKEE